MSTEAVERIERRPMSFDDYLGLPERPRAEFVDGVALMTPPGTSGHSNAARRTANSIESQVPGVSVVTEAGVRTSSTRIRIPDVAVFAEFEDTAISSQVPLVVVEVVSPSSRTEDTIRKFDEYRQAGIGQYWILDREHRSLTALRNGGESWDVLLELTAEHLTGTVEVEGQPVVLDLADLLA